MQIITLTLSVLSIGSAIAQTVHVMTVGGTNGTIEFSPNNIKAAIGDMVQFQFNPKNHTVTQSSFDQPCVPIANNANSTGIYSGFMPVSANDTTRPTYTIPVTSTKPMWLYCSQAKHCQNGMVAVINEDTAANATRSLTNYMTLAKSAPANLAPGQTVASSTSSTSDGTSSSSGTSSGTTSSGTTSLGTTSSDTSPSSSSSSSSSGLSSSSGSGSSSGSSSSSGSASTEATSTIPGTTQATASVANILLSSSSGVIPGIAALVTLGLGFVV